MTNVRPHAVIAAALAAAASLLLTACGSSSTPLAGHANTSPAHATPNGATTAAGVADQASNGGAASGTSADPCSLLTQAEVDTAAGQPLGHGNRAGALQDCQWSTSDFAASVELDVSDWSAIKTKSAESGQTLTSIPGVGDEALTLNRAGNAAELYVRKGSTGFLLLLGGGQYIDSLPDLGLAQESVLAAAVLGRL